MQGKSAAEPGTPDSEPPPPRFIQQLNATSGLIGGYMNQIPFKVCQAPWFGVGETILQALRSRRPQTAPKRHFLSPRVSRLTITTQIVELK
jgi:hypothetical protein